MKNVVFTLVLFLGLMMSACSNKDYLNAVPAESTLLISMNTAKLSGVGSQALLKSVLHVSNFNQSGIDISSPVMFFEDAQGNLGLCAKTADADDLEALLKKLGLQVSERRGFHFAALPNNWLIGYSDESVLMMGPVLPAAQAEMMQLMTKYLKADDDDGIVSTPMYEKLDSIDAPMSLVCQSKALPEQLVTPFTLGAPKNTDPSQILIAAELEVKNHRLMVNGQTFSFNKKVNEALTKAYGIYRPIKGNYVASMSADDAMGMFMDVDGSKFITLMTDNRGMQALLAGINAAIDMNNIIKSFDGDMAIMMPEMGQDKLRLKMAAKLKNADWLADVDYWKQSVPDGGVIADWGRDCYYYRDSKTSYYFGVTGDWQYMSGDSQEAALQSIKPAIHPIDKTLQDQIKGQKLVLVLNLKTFGGDKASAVTSLMRPMFGDVQSIVYTLK